jgi:phosphoglycerate dehydrogenase-like enzyme
MHLGIVGMGAIGSEVARLAAAFEMEVVGVRRRPRGDEPCTTWPTDEMPQLLTWADAIVLCAPLTDDTRGIFDAAAFASMRQGAWLINVGRGEVVDEPAMIDALACGHLGGAGLDVFTVEPLPDDSPLWSMPNVIITPHSSGITTRSYRRSIDLFIDNFGRYTRGEPLRNVVVR